MKITAFYVTKNQRVIEEKDVTKLLQDLGKVGVSALVLTQATPFLMGMVGNPIVAHASTIGSATANVTTVSGGVDKILVVADDLISALQKIAEPTAYAFCVKGILEKMSGQDVVGAKHMKEALKGYVTIQVLPMVFDLINVFR